jgi:hypothetical protein
MEKIAVILITFLPTLYEAFTDRLGESKKDKLWDGVILAGYSILLVGGAWWLGYRPLSVIGLILGFRILLFDYLVQYLLIKNKVIVGHWFDYSGKTSWFDQKVAGINPWIRFAARLVVFALAVWYYIQ